MSALFPQAPVPRQRPAWLGKLPDLKVVHRRWPSIVSTGVLLAGIVVMVIAAINAHGLPVRQVDLNDGGVWLTSDEAGLFGRLNRPAGSLDAVFSPPGEALTPPLSVDVLQNDSAVVAWDRNRGLLYPVDVARGVAVGEGLPVPASYQTRLLGGTLAVLDPATGQIWASRVDTSSSLSGLALDLAGEPLATVEVGAAQEDAGVRAALAVGADGAVHAASVTGATVTIRPTGAVFGPAEPGHLGRGLTAVQVTAVGDRMVVLDPGNGTLLVPGGEPLVLPGAGSGTAKLQWPGEAHDSVLVATATALLAVPLGGGEPTVLYDAMSGSPALPVRLGECAYAAWAGATGGYARGCGSATVDRGPLEGEQPLVDPVFRMNRRAVVLNDMRNGAAWDLEEGKRVDNWKDVVPPPVKSTNVPPEPNPDPRDLVAQPPKAVDDKLGARPGRTTLLHVLDNDSDPSGNVLSIVEFTQPSIASATLAISPDGQTLALTLTEAEGPIEFQYTIDDGQQRASAKVTVEVRGPDQNEAPKLWQGYKDPQWTVLHGARLAMPVLADWRDYDGDPVALASATLPSGQGTVTARADGFLDFLAPAPADTTDVTIDYVVSDGKDSTEASLSVEVLGATTTQTRAPQTRPDVARGQAGSPIVIHPLDNDIPGADPANPAARLTLAGEVNSVADAIAQTNLATGTVVVTAARPGTYEFSYTAAFGNAAFADDGKIRVDVMPAPDSPRPPVAMPDSAVLRGQLPSTVDVLANDFDPAGGVLALLHAEPADETVRLQVAIVEGRWLRINALDASTSAVPQVVRYWISNGTTAPVVGEVSVTRLAAPTDTTPVPVDDVATVRSGETVTVAVLDNDSAGGAPIMLAANVLGAPAGQLVVTAPGEEDPGAAYVTGNLVRYVAPEVTEARQVTVDYVVRNDAGDAATGHLKVTVVPPPSDANPNRPPAPQPIEARAVSGQTVTLDIPTTGVDADGDPVTVIGIAAPPTLGRIVAMNATSIAYQPFPAAAGTDAFTYLVTDRYGGIGQAGVRVGVTPPGSPQPPVAVDDIITADPDAQLHIDVLANDLITPGDAVTVLALEQVNSELPPGTRLGEGNRLVETIAPDPREPFTVLYAVQGGVGAASIGRITVRGQEGYNNPPVAYDFYADPEPGATTVEADLHKSWADPDGNVADIKIVRVLDPAATVSGTVVTLPVTDVPRTVAYEISDRGGATGIGLIHVSVPGSGLPYLLPGASIEIGQNSATSFDINDYVVSPSGRPLRLTTTDRIWAAPPQGLLAATRGETGVELTSIGDYVGPAAVTFEVTDGETLSDPTARTALVSVPVQVGPPTPVLHCPFEPVGVVEGGRVETLNLAKVCNVWVADPAELPELTFSASWSKPADGISMGGDRKPLLTLEAASGTRPGTIASIEIGVEGTQAVPDTLLVKVLPAPLATFRPILVDGVHEETAETISISDYVRSSLREPAWSVIGVSQVSGMPATATVDGMTVTVTPAKESHGPMVFAVTVTDVADRNRGDRHVIGELTVVGWARPDPPGAPTSAGLRSHAAELLWDIPASNGTEILYYDVSWTSSAGNGQQRCEAPPCTILGLTNNVGYVFTVVAVNRVGASPESPPSAPITPDQVPPAVTGLVASNPQDRTLTLSWQPVQVDGSPVQRYDISWGGGGFASTTATTFNPSNLDNEIQYTFTVVPVNNAGAGPGTTVTGQSAGAPARPAAPTFSSLNSVDSTSRAVTVSWAPVSPNGPGPTTYTVVRTGNGTVTICANVTATSCPDDGIPNDGTIYTYTVTAENAAAAGGPNHTSPPSPGTTMEATATPDPITTYSIAPTGVDGQAQLSFNVPPSHGASSTVNCSFNGTSCGSWSYPVGGQTGVVRTINGLSNGVSTAVSLQVCNGSSGGAGAGTPCNTPVARNVTTYGNMHSLNISTSRTGSTINYTVSVDPNGKPAQVRVQSNHGQDETFTTGNGAWSRNFSRDIGWNNSITITVTVTDPGRPTLNQQATATTPNPPPTVTVSKGAACGTAVGVNCAGYPDHVCNNTCWYIHIATANFSGNVTCSVTDSQGGSPAWHNVTWGPNQSADTNYWSGQGGTTVIVTCDGVQGSAPW